MSTEPGPEQGGPYRAAHVATAAPAPWVRESSPSPRLAIFAGPNGELRVRFGSGRRIAGVLCLLPLLALVGMIIMISIANDEVPPLMSQEVFIAFVIPGALAVAGIALLIEREVLVIDDRAIVWTARAALTRSPTEVVLLEDVSTFVVRDDHLLLQHGRRVLPLFRKCGLTEPQLRALSQRLRSAIATLRGS